MIRGALKYIFWIPLVSWPVSFWRDLSKVFLWWQLALMIGGAAGALALGIAVTERITDPFPALGPASVPLGLVGAYAIYQFLSGGVILPVLWIQRRFGKKAEPAVVWPYPRQIRAASESRPQHNTEGPSQKEKEEQKERERRWELEARARASERALLPKTRGERAELKKRLLAEMEANDDPNEKPD
jgi:hypothetical protein